MVKFGKFYDPALVYILNVCRCEQHSEWQGLHRDPEEGNYWPEDPQWAGEEGPWAQSQERDSTAGGKVPDRKRPATAEV